MRPPALNWVASTAFPSAPPACRHPPGTVSGAGATPALQVFAEVNGSLWGAGVDAAVVGVVDVPLPLLGRAELRLVVLPTFSLDRLYAGANSSGALASSASLVVRVTPTRVPVPLKPGSPSVGIEYDLRRGTDPIWPGGCPGCNVPQGTPLVGRYRATDPRVMR